MGVLQTLKETKLLPARAAPRDRGGRAGAPGASAGVRGAAAGVLGEGLCTRCRGRKAPPAVTVLGHSVRRPPVRDAIRKAGSPWPVQQTDLNCKLRRTGMPSICATAPLVGQSTVPQLSMVQAMAAGPLCHRLGPRAIAKYRQCYHINPFAALHASSCLRAPERKLHRIIRLCSPPVPGSRLSPLQHAKCMPKFAVSSI